MAVMEIPRDVTELTPEWLSRALEAGGFPGARVRSVESGSGQSRESIIGQVVRLRLEYEPGSGRLPATMMAKFPTRDADRHAYFTALGMYEREARFYQQLARRVGIRTPDCYFAGIDEKGASLLLLEDLAPLTAGDRVRGCSEDVAATALETAAVLHATWWASDELARLDWLQSYDIRLLTRRFQAVWPGFRRANATLTDYAATLGDRFYQNPEPLLALFRAPLTLVHHDFQLDNLFFTGDPAQPFVVIDWQLITLGRGALDVANFLCWNLLPPIRRDSQASLLRRYHEALLERGVTAYSQDACQQDYRLGLLECFVRVVSIMGSDDSRSDEMAALFETILTRTIAAVEDTDVAAVFG